jgi:hypothetical protein
MGVFAVLSSLDVAVSYVLRRFDYSVVISCEIVVRNYFAETSIVSELQMWQWPVKLSITRS